ncbi:hypothetical protein B0H15DRAFT_952575 [Mycena belliarum]|uniref:Uncharacterized protein n=1 Tax=Mycena belliarum TaxID=1033014 RepID=A0AAD6TYN2_9AGAR|nr:hypothetical protein B0H15DRAFT_952575 [Mycena belliae]
MHPLDPLVYNPALLTLANTVTQVVSRARLAVLSRCGRRCPPPPLPTCQATCAVSRTVPYSAAKVPGRIVSDEGRNTNPHAHLIFYDLLYDLLLCHWRLRDDCDYSDGPARSRTKALEDPVARLRELEHPEESTHAFFFRSMTTGVLARTALTGVLYTRAVGLSPRARIRGAQQQHGAEWFHAAWTAPIQGA